MARVGILGGTGFSALTDRADVLPVETPWGEVPVALAREGDLSLFLVRRHGPAHLPPHRIVHRANVEALARCKVDAVLALNAVGALRPDLPAGALLVPHDVLDLRTRTETFHDDAAVHVDMAEPYCPTLRALLLRAAAAEGKPAHAEGVYACTEGPRLETPAEVRMLRAVGGDVVGMTGMPETSLARERALCYASLCLVTNPAAGLAPAGLRAQDLRAGAEALAPLALRIALRAARDVRDDHACRCRHALHGARI